MTALASQPVSLTTRSFRRRESVIAAAPMVRSTRVEGSGTRSRRRGIGKLERTQFALELHHEVVQPETFAEVAEEAKPKSVLGRLPVDSNPARLRSSSAFPTHRCRPSCSLGTSGPVQNSGKDSPGSVTAMLVPFGSALNPIE